MLPMAKLEKKLSNKKGSSSKRGIKCDLTLMDMHLLYSRNNGCCDYTGIPFDEDSEWDCSSIERINPSLGYTLGNVCLVNRHVNSLKDCVLDRVDLDSFKVQRSDLPLIATLQTKLTAQYLMHLKSKYKRETEYNKETDPYKDHFKPLTPEVVVAKVEAQPIQQEIKVMSQDQWTEEQKAANKLPDDVLIAGYYAGMARAAQKTGMKFDISYAEFKGRFGRKTCALSGKVLTLDDKFVLVLDSKKPLSRENLAVVDEQLGHKVNKMSEEMGISIEEMAKMFKRLA